MLVKVRNLPKNIQVSCSLLEMCRSHVVMLQMNFLQVANIQRLVDNSLESFTICQPNPQRIVVYVLDLK